MHEGLYVNKNAIRKMKKLIIYILITWINGIGKSGKQENVLGEL